MTATACDYAPVRAAGAVVTLAQAGADAGRHVAGMAGKRFTKVGLEPVCQHDKGVLSWVPELAMRGAGGAVGP